MKDTSLQYLTISLMAALMVYAALNVSAFWLIFGTTLTPLELPYSEDFDDLSRLDYRQFGGIWRIEDDRLLQVQENDSDLMAVVPLQITAEQNYHLEAQIEFLSGQHGGGLIFNLQHSENRVESHLVRFGSDAGQTYLVFGYFDAQANFVEQGRIPYSFSTTPERVMLAVNVHGSDYDVLVDNIPASEHIPLEYQGGMPALVTWFSQIAFDNVSISPLTTAESVTASPSESAPPQIAIGLQPAPVGTAFTTRFDTGDGSSQWQPFSGNWAFEPGALVQTNTGGYDNDISYLESFSHYLLTVQFSHRQSVGGGVLFNMPQSDSQRGAHMVRYFPDNSLVWGYFDANTIFQGQGDRLVDPPGNGSHQLQITVGAASYDIRLDGQSIASDIPLISPQGYIGLTASQSVVAFEQVTVQALEGLSAPPLSLSTGNWVRSDNLLTQTRLEDDEYFNPVGVHGETFNVSVSITLPDSESDRVGAGLIFHAGDSTNPAHGAAVRILGSQQVAWGVMDAQNQFQALGSVPVELTDDPHLLSLRVRAADYDILVDGQTIAEALPLTAAEGWLYFDAVGGPITFSDFTMSLTESRN